MRTLKEKLQKGRRGIGESDSKCERWNNLNQEIIRNSIDPMTKRILDCIKLKIDRTKHKASYFIINLIVKIFLMFCRIEKMIWEW